MATNKRRVLIPEQLNDTDEQILAFMSERGRVTPSWIADARDLSRAYVSQRLKRLKEHGHVEQPHRGLWDLVDDPREKTSEEGRHGDATPTVNGPKSGFHDPDEVVAWVREHQPASRADIVAEFHDDSIPINAETFWTNYVRPTLKDAGFEFIRNQGWQK